MKKIMMLMVCCLFLIACNDTPEVVNEYTVVEYEQLLLEKEALIETLREEAEMNQQALINKMNTLDAKIERHKEKIINLEEALIKQMIPNRQYENMLILTPYEMDRLEAFKKDYDDEMLKNLSPLSVCKLYLYSSFIDDQETVWELFTDSQNGWYWSKEEHMSIDRNDHVTDFSIYEDVYALTINMESYYDETASVTWYSRNGYFDENQPWQYYFSLEKYDDIWKVTFLPMQ